MIHTMPAENDTQVQQQTLMLHSLALCCTASPPPLEFHCHRVQRCSVEKLRHPLSCIKGRRSRSHRAHCAGGVLVAASCELEGDPLQPVVGGLDLTGHLCDLPSNHGVLDERLAEGLALARKLQGLFEAYAREAHAHRAEGEALVIEVPWIRCTPWLRALLSVAVQDTIARTRGCIMYWKPLPSLPSRLPLGTLTSSKVM